MKMVGMGGVVVWPQAVTIVAAAGTKHRPQPGLGFILFPAAQHRHLLPVGEAKATDVQRLSGGVLAQPGVGAMVYIATGIAAKMIDTHQLAGHIPCGQRPGLLLYKKRRAERQRTGGEKAAAELNRAKVSYPYGISQRTGTAAVGDRLGSDQPFLVGLRQQGIALLGRQPLELKLGNTARRIVEAQWRKGVVIRGQVTITHYPCPYDK